MAYGQHLDVLGGIGGGSRRRRMLGLQTGLVRSERAAVGPNLPALGRAEGMRRRQMGTLSRGFGAPAAPTRGPSALQKGVTYRAEGPMGGTPSLRVSERRGGPPVWGPEGAGYVPPEGGGVVRLSGSYLTPEQTREQAIAQRPAWQENIAAPEAQAAFRAQTGPGMRRERAMGMAPPVQGIEDIATGQALGAQTRAQAMAGIQEAGPQAAATTARMQAEAKMPGTIGAAYVQNLANQDQQAQVAALGEMSAALRAAGRNNEADLIDQKIQDVTMGGHFEVGAETNWLEDIANWFLSEGNEYKQESQFVPAPGRAAAMGGVSGPTAGAQAGVGDQDERELWERLRAKYGG